MSLVGFKAKNHPQQETVDHVDDRRTPWTLWSALHADHKFTIDVAASPDNTRLPRFYTLEQDGLRQDWKGERVWCNPPYSDIEPWVVKAWESMVSGGCQVVVMLLPANRCEQRWWQRHVEYQRDQDPIFGEVKLGTRFLSGRLRFEWPADRVVPPKGDRPPFGCVLLTWERKEGEND